MKGISSLVFLKIGTFNVNSQGDRGFCIRMRSDRIWTSALGLPPRVSSSMADGSHGAVLLSQGEYPSLRVRAFEAARGSAHASTHQWPAGQLLGRPDVHVRGWGVEGWWFSHQAVRPVIFWGVLATVAHLALDVSRVPAVVTAAAI